jgi:monovalent cation:H+ antiporter-2, CPA2 family
MHNLDLILTLTIGLAAALAFGFVSHRLGLSPIVGYLLAGVAVGPSTPGFVANQELAEQLAEIGIILLMFGVGLQFHFKELLAVRRIAIPGAIGQGLVTTALGTVAGKLLGWDWTAGLVFGLAISVASTVVLVRVLADNNDLHMPTGHIAVGWLVVEDLFTVVVLVVLPALSGEASQLPLALGMALVKIVILVACVFLVGGRLIPWLLGLAARTGSRELFTLTILVVALGIAVSSATLFGVSMALGAFLAGMVVGRSDFSLRAASEAMPMRDAFAVLFFVSVGMLFNPGSLLDSPWLTVITLVFVLLCKPAAALGIVLWFGYPVRVALATAVALAQIGEFSFILASLGKSLHILPGEAMSTLVAVSIVSISLNPILYRLVDPFEAWASRRPWVWRWLTWRVQPQLSAVAAPDAPAPNPAHRAIVVGYGPVGRTLSRLLRENGVQPTIIEMNLDNVARVREEGVGAVYGDANHAETLKSAGVADSATLILSASNIRNPQEIIRLVKLLNPNIRVIVRTAYLHERSALREAGADSVFAGEGEVALAMTELILFDLGATPEQMDRERERLRADLAENQR